MFDIRDGLPPGLDEERHKSGDVGRRDLVAAALQHVHGVQRERFLVAPVSHPQSLTENEVESFQCLESAAHDDGKAGQRAERSQRLGDSEWEESNTFKNADAALVGFQGLILSQALRLANPVGGSCDQ